VNTGSTARQRVWYLHPFFLWCLCLVLLCLAAADGRGATDGDTPGKRIEKLAKQAEELRKQGEEKQAGGQALAEKEQYEEAYAAYKEALTVVRERGDVLREAAKLAQGAGRAGKLTGLLDENAGWEEDIEETLNLLKLSL